MISKLGNGKRLGGIQKPNRPGLLHILIKIYSLSGDNDFTSSPDFKIQLQFMTKHVPVGTIFSRKKRPLEKRKICGSLN